MFSVLAGIFSSGTMLTSFLGCLIFWLDFLFTILGGLDFAPELFYKVFYFLFSKLEQRDSRLENSFTSLLINKLPFSELGTTELSSNVTSPFFCRNCYIWLVLLVRDIWVDDDTEVGVYSLKVCFGYLERSSSLLRFLVVDCFLVWLWWWWWWWFCLDADVNFLEYSTGGALVYYP